MSSTTTSPDYRRGYDDGVAGKRPDVRKMAESPDYLEGYEDGWDEWEYFDGDR